MRLHPRSPFFGLYSSRFYIEKLKGTMTTCIIVIVPMCPIRTKKIFFGVFASGT